MRRVWKRSGWAGRDASRRRKILSWRFGYAVSSPYCRTDRFKARLRLSPEPRVVITPEPGYPFSIPNFLVHEPKAFAYMMPEPHGEFLQRMIEAGEPVLFREYAAPVFEIDTPEDLAEARRFFQR